MTKSAIPENYFSEKTISHLKPQQGLSERYKRRAQDVKLAWRLTHAYAKYHLAMLHRQLAMSDEQIAPWLTPHPRLTGMLKGISREK